MMTIQEVRENIYNEKRKRDLRREMTPANSKIMLQKGGGTFEAVYTGRGNEKCLIPEIGTLHYLYRGQNQEFKPCIPTIYRGNPSGVEIFVERMRLVVFKRLIASHPVIKGFFQKHNFKVDIEGLAQHYGLKTSMLDLTSNLDVALFFATCWYNKDSNSYQCYDDGREHDAILYVFSPILDNEPNPSLVEDSYSNHNITPIGLQAFHRPGAQYGYSLHIAKGNSTKCWIYRFKFSCEESKYYYNMFKKEKFLFIEEDVFISKTNQIANQTDFSFDVFNKTFHDYGPKGFSKTKLKAALPTAIRLSSKIPDILFSNEEIVEIIKDWNNHTGRKTASMIRRKPWFEYDNLADDETGEGQKRIGGVRNRCDYRTLKHISIQQLMSFVANPDSPYGAEWINYTSMPRPKRKHEISNSDWRKIPGTMENMFGKEFLTEEDLKI